MSSITVSIRDLHARTGHFVRKAGENPVIITDNGKPVAELHALSGKLEKTAAEKKSPKWKNRVLLPGYAAIRDKPHPGDSSGFISEDRERGSNW